MKRISVYILSSLVLLLAVCAPSHALGNAEDQNSETRGDLLLFFEEDELILTATKQLQRVKDAPAIATVITAEQIRDMGARNIVDVLRTVPGIGMTKGHYGKEEIEVRGIKTINSEKVLFLIDGVSVNMVFEGGYAFVADGLSLDNVKRIEVVRGPGSALYGDAAFSAVINVITKDGKDIDGVILKAGAGTFNTRKYNLQAGRSFEDLDIAVALDYYSTDGDSLYIRSDIVGMSGYTEDDEEKIEADLKASYEDITFHTKVIKRKTARYLGVAYALGNSSELDIEFYLAELLYNTRVGDSANVEVRAYYVNRNGDGLWYLYPGGVIPGFPDGMVTRSVVSNLNRGVELKLDYELFEGNLLSLGVLGEEQKQYGLRHEANYDPVTGVQLPSMQEVADINVEKTRRIQAIYMQDIWKVTENVELTAGVRHDHYSDFGNTTNPRLALVWKFLDDWDAKFLYGTAFRAPSYIELYNKHNPVETGNPDLDPERMTTFEASLGHSPDRHNRFRATYFHNEFKDKIVPVPVTGSPSMLQYENSGGAKVDGLELETSAKITRTLTGYANYTYQHPVDSETGDRLPDVPSHKGNLGINAIVYGHTNLNLNAFICGERPRAEGDVREPLAGYALLDLTLIVRELYPGLELRGSVYNVLDRKYSDPAPANTVADDYPREGRSAFLEASYKF